MSHKRVVVIGASSGGIEALKVLVAGLPPDFPAPVCVVLHTAPDSPGMLVPILNRAGWLTVVSAETGMRLDDGRIYVAPPDHHLIIEPGVLCISKGPRENRFRPAIDPLFRSAARVYGPAAIGVVLTGSLDDGTAGLWTIKRLGGQAIVQDPADALFPSMPVSALAHVDVDYTLPLPDIAPLLVRVVASPVADQPMTVPEPVEVEVKIASQVNAIDAGLEGIAHPSAFSCPECHGVLLRLKEEQPLRFRCHTGHAYSIDSLIAAVSEGVDAALWTAVRALEEAGLLMQHVASHLDAKATGGKVAQLDAQANAAHHQSEIVRRVATERDQLMMVQS